MELRYLPIPLIRVIGEVTDNTQQFQSEITSQELQESHDIHEVIGNHIRKISLDMQKQFRKRIRMSNRGYEHFCLKIYTDLTIVERVQTDSPIFIYCIVELSEVG